MKNIVKKNYYIRTTQSKIEGSSLLSKKREGRLMYQDKKRLFDDSEWIVKLIYCWYHEKSRFISKISFEKFKLWRRRQAVIFIFCWLAAIITVMILFSQDDPDIFYFCPHNFTDFNKLFSSNRKCFKFIFHFRCNYILRNSKLLISCQSCIDEHYEIFSNQDCFERIKTSFIRYLIEKIKKKPWYF